MKTCSKCKIDKPVAEFTYNGPRLYSYCRRCNSERQKEYRQKNLEKSNQAIRKCYLRNLYGITEAEYDRILASQGGHCVFCDATRNPGGNRLCVDHCHKTGKVRGILCITHNRALGSFGDDIEGLEKAVEYLKRAAEK